jgi:HEAT repeat protein
MKNQANLSELNLRTNLNDLSREMIHELFLLSRKVGIYSADHPMAVKGISRPFTRIQKVFAFKKYFSLMLTEGHLYANNIMMPDANFSEYIKEAMQRLEIRSILFGDQMTADELLAFIGRLVKRMSPADANYRMEKYLEHKKIYSILVNTDLAEKLFTTGLRYQGDIPDDYSVRKLVANYFSGEIDLAVTVLSSHFTDSEKQAVATGIDYHPDIVRFILPEKFAQLQPSELVAAARQIINAGSQIDESAADRLARLVRSFDYHPKRGDLLDQIQDLLQEKGLGENVLKQSVLMAGSLKLEAVQNVDRAVNKIFSNDFTPEQYGTFNDAFTRLARTRQMGKASGITENIIEFLAADQPQFRQHAVALMHDIVKAVVTVGETEFLDVIVRHIQSLFTRGRETYEFADVTVYLVKSMLSLRRYEAVAQFLGTLKSARRSGTGVTTYDSFIVRRIFEKLDDTDLIARLIRELQQPGDNQTKFIRDILIAVQSENVALQLSAIVAHPDRNVRQHCLKVLSELGRPALVVFSELLRDDSNFARPEGRHELPDDKWFVIRNAIFVLGNLRQTEACEALRVRLSDPDTRVRRELVTALEKIGGDEAVDLLMILTEDIDQGIREASIIALGLFQRHDLVPFFVDLLPRQRNEVGRIVNAIVQSGSPDGRDFLGELLCNDDRLKALASGKASIQDIKGFIMAALEKIGDEASLRKIAEYQERLKGRPIFSDDGALGKTAKVLINKIQGKK